MLFNASASMSFDSSSHQAQGALALSIEDFRARYPRETREVEFKSGVSGRALQEAVVAMSNTDGGVVLIGVNDDGVVLGKELTQNVEESIHQAVAEARNVGRYDLSRFLVGDKPVIALSVRPRVEGFAQTSSGRILVRRGPRNEPLFDADLLRFVSEKALDRFELQPTRRTLADANPLLIDELVTAFQWQNAEPDRFTEHSLIDREGKLTIAGALFLLTDPATELGKAYIEVMRFPAGSSDYDRRLEFRGPLHRQVLDASSSVMDELGTELVVIGTQRYDLPRLPLVVVREAIANAVAHRSYEARGTAVRVEIRPDEVRVVSPGPLPVPVTVDNIRDAQAARNLATIRVLRRFGVAEDAGRGVDVMMDEMRAELLDPPAFADSGHAVEVTLPVRSPVTGRERAWVREVERRGELVPADRIILVHAARGEEVTNRRVRELTGLDRVEAMRALQRLRNAGFLQQYGTRGGATYVLGESLAPPAGLRLAPAELRRAVAEMAGEEPITNQMVRERFGIDRVDALRVLDGLVKDGKLRRVGERRGTRYVSTS